MCGVVGAFNVQHASVVLRHMLHALQNRGRDGCGIFTTSTKDNETTYHVRKFLGTVADHFTSEVIETLPGKQGIGHTRYATVKGADSLQNLQPLYFDDVGGLHFAIAHNGNFTNVEEVQKTVLYHTPFNTSLDTERFFRLTLRENRKHGMLQSIANALSKMQGSCSALINTPDSVIAVRDASGNRPLFWGKKGKGYVLASETCALDSVGVLKWHEVPAGTIMSFSKEGIETVSLPEQPLRMCTFELLYFAFPTSVIFDVPVGRIRREFGRRLSEVHDSQTDLIIGIPDSGTPAAHGYSYGLRNTMADEDIIVRRHDTGKTFILRSQRLRRKAVSEKFDFATHLLRGKTVTLVDDSLVRGTTSLGITKALRKRGVREVHWRIPSPKVIESCYYGIATNNRESLLAVTHAHDEMRQEIDADSLEFLDLPHFQDVLRQYGLPTASGCFTCMNGVPWHKQVVA